MDDVTTAGVTIVTGGVGDSKPFREHIRDAGDDPDEWFYCDLTEHLHKNPGKSVEWHCDGKNENTQRIVIEQDGFETVFWLIFSALFGEAPDDNREYRKVFFHCRTGWHRASTVGMFLVCALNYLCHGATRVFNAQWFGLHDARGPEGWSAIADAAMAWASAPWQIMSGGRRPYDQLYAYTMCSKYPYCSAVFHRIYDHLSDMCPPPPPPPRNPASSSAPASISTPIAPTGPRQPATPPPPPVHAHDDTSRTHDDRVAQKPAWATFEPNVEVWWALFDEHNVDDKARQSLFALAQLSPEGYQSANSLVSKLIKKVSDGDILGNASAFVHAGCKHARHELDPRFADQKKARTR
jgi:hypothetical protein